MANESARIQGPRSGVYAGSFDPITLGHLDIIFQAAAVLPKLYVVVGVNSEKNPIFTHAERVEMITREIEEGIKPKLAEAGYETEIIVASHKGLMVSFMEAHNAPIFVRGLRLGTEFDKEYPSLVAQRYEYPDFKPMFLCTTYPELQIVSSSLAREIASLQGKSLAHYVTPSIAEKLQARLKPPVKRGFFASVIRTVSRLPGFTHS